MTWRLKGLLAVFIFLLLIPSSCGRQRLKVVYLPPPDYPSLPLSLGIQGTVLVRTGIGTDGKVTYAVGRGAQPALIRAAEDNVKGWRFEVPEQARFPIEHQVKYTFTFNKDGAPNTFPTVVTDLPDAVEVIGTPIQGDKVILVPSEPKK